MNLKRFSSLQTMDSILQRIQDGIIQSINPVVGLPILPGNLIEGISITSGTPLTVNHGLGRDYRLWFVVKLNANASIWESTSSDASQYVVLNASANCQVSLWVA